MHSEAIPDLPPNSCAAPAEQTAKLKSGAQSSIWCLEWVNEHILAPYFGSQLILRSITESKSHISFINPTWPIAWASKNCKFIGIITSYFPEMVGETHSQMASLWFGLPQFSTVWILWCCFVVLPAWETCEKWDGPFWYWIALFILIS